MADLSVTYLNLKLANPFLVSSCRITGTLAGIQQCAEQGAGAVVLQSLFEEQIDMETGLHQASQDGSALHPEALDYLTELGKERGADQYLQLITDAKRAVDIPVIASINCVSDRWWMDFASQLVAAGADALELNIGLLPNMASEDGRDIEARTLAIVKEVRSRVNVPLAVKIGPYYSSLPALVDGLTKAGADSLVLFNRFFRLDIDIESMSFVRGSMFSSSDEAQLPLRWLALLSPHCSVPLSASTGVHSGADAIKMILAGAQVVQFCSVLYMRKVNHLPIMIEEMNSWMDRHEYASLGDLRGKMAGSSARAKELLGRLQYIKALAE